MLPNVGDRIEIDFDDPEFPNTLTKGARGTVESISYYKTTPVGNGSLTQVWVVLDKHRNCIALIPEKGDKFRVIDPSEEEQHV